MRTILPADGYTEQDVMNALAKDDVYMAEMYTITLIDETILRYTSLDVDIVWGGYLYSSSGLLIKRGSLTLKTGVEVDELALDMYPTTATIDGIGFLAAALNGALDGAIIKLERVFFTEWGGSVLVQSGSTVIGSINASKVIGEVPDTSIWGGAFASSNMLHISLLSYNGSNYYGGLYAAHDYGCNFAWLDGYTAHNLYRANGIAGSADGKYQFIVNTEQRKLLRSDDYAQSFTSVAELEGEISDTEIRVSSDGRYILYKGRTVTSGNWYTIIWQSNDYGVTFTSWHTYGSGIPVADYIGMSPDGQYQYIFGYFMLKSTDYGANWANTAGITDTWSMGQLRVSADRKYLFAARQNGADGEIFRNSNYGDYRPAWIYSAWIGNIGLYSRPYLSVSSTGQYLSVIVQSAYTDKTLHVSSDYGDSWTIITTPVDAASGEYSGVAMSTDAKYQMVVIRNLVFQSDNYGVDGSWTATSPVLYPDNWPAGASLTASTNCFVMMSADGLIRIACFNGKLWFSEDGGVNWDDHATHIYRTFNYNCVGGISLFKGKVSDIEMGRTGLNLKVKSALEFFNVQFPRNVYTPGCGWLLYGEGCGASKLGFTFSGIVSSDSTKNIIKTNLTKEDGYFDQGVITFTSGVNAGARRTIKSYLAADGQVILSKALVNIPNDEDTFDIYPGCDHMLETCTNKFNNAINYRGFPYIPSPETAR